MLFGPRRCSFLLALALAARAIVVLIGGLFNCHRLDVTIGPLVQLEPVKTDSLFPDREFADVRPHRFIELIPAHAEIAVCLAGANEAREDWRDLCRASICHGDIPRRRRRQKVLMKGHAVLPWGDGASQLFGAAADVLGDAVAVGDDPPKASESVRDLDGLRDGHGALPCPGERCRAGRQKVVCYAARLPSASSL
ncbi:hypothetical protein EMIT0P2_210067 [Pseudomonas sp. IT-P2]